VPQERQREVAHEHEIRRQVADTSANNRRKLFFREFQVLKVRRRIYGHDLAPDEILVKLRAPDQRARWVMLARNVFESQKRFRVVPRTT
jgi:hypothetical protein